MLAGEARPGFRRAPHATPRAALALAQIAAPDARLWYRQPFAPGGNRDTCVERIPLMNPADVAPAALPLVSADVSLIALFLQAHWVVKTVMLGLLACSVWVWGIMSGVQSIAASKNTSLAVVAPGIAEALFATAIGLIAAIPATIFYNKFTSEVNRQAQRLEGFADEFSAILSRQIDERA